MAQFNYCPLIWMCHNRTHRNKINRLHERCLRLIYNDKRSSFEDLLEKDNSVSIHHKNLQALANEMFQVHTKTSPNLGKWRHMFTKTANVVWQQSYTICSRERPFQEDTYFCQSSYSHCVKVSKYGVFSALYFPAFGLNTDQKKLRIWTLFTHSIVYYAQDTRPLEQLRV